MKRRHLVFESGNRKGLGDTLICILNLAYYANRWGRVLALDLRNFQYINKDPHTEFFRKFELCVPDKLAITTDLNIIDSLYSCPSYRLVTGKDDISISKDFEEEVVVAGQTFACDHLYTPEDKLSSHLYRVKLKGILRDEIRNILSGHCWDNSIGVHFRHGNGEFLVKRFDPVKSKNYEKDYTSIKEKYVDAVYKKRKEFEHQQNTVFVTGDNREFVSDLRSKIQGSATLNSQLPDKPYQDYLFDQKQNPEILRDAVLDLWALSSCDYLVCGESLFTDFALLNSQKLNRKRVSVITAFSIETLLNSGDLEETIQAIKSALARAPNNIKLYQALASALSRSGAKRETYVVKQKIAYLRQNLRFRPIFVDILIRHGQIEKAINALQCAGDSWQNVAQQKALLGSLLSKTGRNVEASEAYGSALALDHTVQKYIDQLEGTPGISQQSDGGCDL